MIVDFWYREVRIGCFIQTGYITSLGISVHTSVAPGSTFSYSHVIIMANVRWFLQIYFPSSKIVSRVGK